MPKNGKKMVVEMGRYDQKRQKMGVEMGRRHTVGDF